MWQYLLTAIAFLLVFEGLIPFISPRRWRILMFTAMQFNDRTLRILGLVSMIVGAVLMYLVHSGLIFD